MLNKIFNTIKNTQIKMQEEATIQELKKEIIEDYKSGSIFKIKQLLSQIRHFEAFKDIDSIPTSREIAEHVGVSQTTVMNVLTILEEEGWILKIYSNSTRNRSYIFLITKEFAHLYYNFSFDVVEQLKKEQREKVELRRLQRQANKQKLAESKKDRLEELRRAYC